MNVGDGLFHRAAHAFVLVLGVHDVDAMPCVWGVAAAGEHFVFEEKGVVCARVELFV
jgi:hypothetical protein